MVVHSYGRLLAWDAEHVEKARAFLRTYGLSTSPEGFDPAPFVPAYYNELRTRFVNMIGLEVKLGHVTGTCDTEHASALLYLAQRDVGIMEPSGGFILSAPTHALHIKHDGAWRRSLASPKSSGQPARDAWVKRDVRSWVRDGDTCPTLTWETALPQRWAP